MARAWRRFLPRWIRKALRSKAKPDQTQATPEPVPATREGVPPSARPTPELPLHAPRALAPVVVNLGIDFGTAFTKVCYRDSALEESGIVTFGALSTPEAMIPAVVSVTEEGDLLFGDGEAPCERIEYLKMRLADLQVPDALGKHKGIDLNSENMVSALSSWYLAFVIRKSTEWILEHDEERFVGREVSWTANVGVPVEYCDSPALMVFERVLKVAWAWAFSGRALSWTRHELPERYAETTRLIRSEAADIHAIPEIAAAARSYLTSRDATPDIYLYFDIGAGTIDGVAFRYVIMDGIRRVNFYSGRVAPLGVAVVGRWIDDRERGSGERALVANSLSAGLREELDPYGRDLRKVVGHVVMTAKKKDLPDWDSLTVFLGGGGAGIKWYRDEIEATHWAFRQDKAGVPEYGLQEVPRPSDLRMNGLDDSAFARFAIAYGLSVPVAEGPDIGLPSEFADVEVPRAKAKDGIVDYQDSKDVYE